MLITILVVLGVIISLSLTANVFLYRAGLRQLNRADLYEQMYNDIVLRTKGRIEETYVQMKQLDDKQMFSKDDDVGVSFREILSILQELNEITQEEETLNE